MDYTFTSPILLSAPQRKISHSVASMPCIPRPIGHPCGEDASLLDACRCGDQFALRRAMVRRHSTSSVNLQDDTGKTALSLVCASGSISVLELLLLVPNLNVNLADNEGNTPSHFAAQAGHVDVITRLTTAFKGVMIIDARNDQGITPLMKAALQGRTKCVRALLNAGANPTLRDPRRGLNAKEWASFCGRKAAEKVIDSYLKTSKGFRENAAKWFRKGDLTFGQRMKQIFSGRHEYDMKHNLIRASSAIVLPAAPTAFDTPLRPLHSLEYPHMNSQMPHVYISQPMN